MDTSLSTPRVLLCAYQCAPRGESVSQIGWQWYINLSKLVPVTLVTHIRNKIALEEVGAPFLNTEIIFIDTEWFAGPLYRMAVKLFPRSEHAAFLISSLDTYVYDYTAVKLLKLKQKVYHWNIVHVPTPVSPKIATRLHSLNLPLVLGPWNGNMPNPRNFSEIMRADSSWLYPIRNLARIPQWLYGTLGNAEAILVATEATFKGIPKSYHHKCIKMIENGVVPALFKEEPWPDFPSKLIPLKIVYVGRLVPFKGVAMLLQAVATAIKNINIQLDIVGEGSQRAELENMAKQIGIHSNVFFHGALTSMQVAEKLKYSHALCLPSVRESGGAVLLEAMSVGRPVIALNFGGPAEIVTDDVGKLIPMTNWGGVVKSLAGCFEDIVKQPEQWKKKAMFCRKISENNFSWTSKIQQAIMLYRKILSK
ncbi:glycosyltransferase family 4 protein [Limnohabitans sp. 2KL-1]|uniref:glycosyltransferase family 4 protein n=1 Tax=Limnohabitans sp. 2KL-1 TaxID=1100699 RepID=UPI0018EE8BAE|nr:glycosyltransferase [Limnohabitans sp. 2KL-1]